MSLDHRLTRPATVATLILLIASPLGAQRPPSPVAPVAPVAPISPVAPLAPAAPAAPVVARSPSVRVFAALPPEPPMAYSFSGFEQSATFGPSLQRFPQDPADSLYREARQLMNRGEYRKAAAAFAKVASHQPSSAYAADALYWQSFALYRIGGTTELRQALTALETRRAKYPDARSEADATTLATRIRGALAARGDAAAAAQVARQASSGGASCDSEELSVRSSALSALLKADPEAAQPLLARVLERTDECSVPLRKNAVVMVGAKPDAAAGAKLATVARNDPSRAVRQDAIRFLARVPGDAAVGTLEQVIRDDSDEQVQRSAVRALGAHESARARAAIRALVERKDAREALRLEAISSFDAGNVGWVISCTDEDCEEAMAQRAPRTAPLAPVARTAPTSPTAQRAPRTGPPRATTAAAAPGAAVPSAVRVFDSDIEREGDFPRLTFAEMEPRSSARRLSAEDAAWLRGVYSRLETTRLQARAAAVLARSADEATLAWLTALIQRDEAPEDVRATVISRLGRDLPIASLSRLYDNAGSRTVRQQIVSTLGERKEPEATDKLIEIVRTGTDASLRRSAINALGRKKDPRTTKLLLELIDK